MEFGQMIRVALNAVLRQIMARGVNRGIGWLARRGDAGEQTPQARAETQKTAARLRQAMRILRRLR